MTLAQVSDALRSHAKVWRQMHNGMGGTSFDILADAIDAHLAERDADTNAFKNFHNQLCQRFYYTHDEVDWRRDQLSLIEHITLLTHPSDAAIAEQSAEVSDGQD